MSPIAREVADGIARAFSRREICIVGRCEVYTTDVSEKGSEIGACESTGDVEMMRRA